MAFYDLHGRRVAEGEAAAGEQFFDWDATGLASGIYFAVVTSGVERATAKIVLIQ